jgi:hypothetical protein
MQYLVLQRDFDNGRGQDLREVTIHRFVNETVFGHLPEVGLGQPREVSL